MKVLIVDHNAVRSHDRGLYRAIAAKPDVSLTLVVPASWREHFGRARFEKEDGTLMVRSSRTIFSGRSHRALYLSLHRFLMFVRPEILYVNSEPEGFLAWEAVILRELLSKETRVVCNSWRNIDYASTGFPYKISALNEQAERTVLQRADHCVAHNHSAEEILHRKRYHKVTVIPPAVDTSLFFKSGLIPAGVHTTVQQFRIAYMGRFVLEKGVDVLLQAAAMLPFDYRLILVGDGPAKSQWVRLAHELGIVSRIEWRGPVAHSGIPEQLRAADVVVLPSRTGTWWKEQFGRILIEAMACGVPVIGSNSGEIPRVIADAGLVFREGDPGALASELQRLHADGHLRARLSATGLKRVNENFSLSRVANLYLQLFHSLLSAPRLY
jgi:glycosyltransferase involved in cell wall biosynthesis